MAKVFLLSTADRGENAEESPAWDLRRLRKGAALDRFRCHEVCDQPHRADLVIFTDPAQPNLADVRTHPVFRLFSERCFVLHAGDRILPSVPGVFTCPERRTHVKRRSRTGPYLRVTFDDRLTFQNGLSAADGPDRLLFSFVGRTETAPVRKTLATLSHPRGLIIDTSMPGTELSYTTYVEVLRRSRFVLCPRGYGSSSFRLFEALKAGRVPVVLSDEWIQPTGPHWDEFALTVPEGAASDLPSILESCEPRYARMSAAARLAWSEWFAADVIFHRTVEWCLELMRGRSMPLVADTALFWLGRLSPQQLLWRWESREWRQKLRSRT